MPKDWTPRTRIHEPTTEELRRLDDLLRQVGGPNVSWGAANRLEVWMAETRLDAGGFGVHAELQRQAEGAETTPQTILLARHR